MRWYDVSTCTRVRVSGDVRSMFHTTQRIDMIRAEGCRAPQKQMETEKLYHRGGSRALGDYVERRDVNFFNLHNRVAYTGFIPDYSYHAKNGGKSRAR